MADIKRAVLSGDKDELEAAIRELIIENMEGGGEDSAVVYTAEDVDAMVGKLEKRIKALEGKSKRSE